MRRSVPIMMDAINAGNCRHHSGPQAAGIENRRAYNGEFVAQDLTLRGSSAKFEDQLAGGRSSVRALKPRSEDFNPFPELVHASKNSGRCEEPEWSADES